MNALKPSTVPSRWPPLTGRPVSTSSTISTSSPSIRVANFVKPTCQSRGASSPAAPAAASAGRIQKCDGA